MTDHAAGLSAARRALLEKRLALRATAGAIPRRKTSGAAPPSFAQQRLWFLDQFAPGIYAYNVPRALRLVGPLDEPALAKALAAIVQRHEVLRTSFAWEEGGLTQTVHAAPPQLLGGMDLRRIADRDREEELRRRLVEELRRPFDLSNAGMLRATLYTLSAEEHVLLVVTHHIASDGWSKAVLFRELAALYDAFSAGAPSPLAALPIQYADFAVWQRDQLTGEGLQAPLAYWKQHLAGAPPVLELPTDRPRPATQTYRGEKQYPALPKALYDGLLALSRREGVTLFMTLMAGFKALLHRYTGQGDIVVGTTVAARTRTETEGLIGFFMNTLALRTDVSDDPTFRALLHREREVALGAYAHQEIPFEKLVEELEPVRDRRRPPLVQVMFLLDTPAAAPKLRGLSVSSIEVDTGASKYDLILALVEEGGQLHGKVEYNTDLFDAATITRFLAHHQALLEGVVANPALRIGEVSLLGDGERQTLAAWNETAAPFPRDRCAHELIEAQASRTPDTVAVAFEGNGMSYAELDRRSNQLAHYLRARGVGADVLVGLALERSAEMVVGILGVWKAGGAYVPLDPSYPRDRFAFMITDAAIPVLITQQRVAKSLPANDAEIIQIDADWPAIAKEPATRPAPPQPEVGPENLAYVIYTSGSTGVPKGVQVSHRALVNFLVSMRLRPGLEERDVLFAVTSLSFDIAGLEIFLPLTVGARVVVVSRDVASDGTRLREQMEDTRAPCTVIQATPATFRLLLEAGWQGSTGLKILCGGEAFPPDLAASLVTRCATLWNMYGPTETTIWSCVHEITPKQPHVRIGRPIANTTLYVLDPHGAQTPIGVPGELYIGGAGVARGYLNRPELTQERFVHDPFRTEEDSRIYRTGDLVRYRPNGDLEFLGRLDHQVKLRGFRIELGEIEAVLCRYPSVRQAVAIVREDVPGDCRLVAYVVADAALASAELRRSLKETLPDIMVPSAFVQLLALPLTPNGKIDRRALPPPQRGGDADDVQRVAPEGPVEQALARIWSEVLGVSSIGADDDFFALGGYSLLAMQVIGKVRTLLGVDLAMRTVFDAPTVTAFAKLVEAERLRLDEEATNALLAQLDLMSEEEASALLAGAGAGGVQ